VLSAESPVRSVAWHPYSKNVLLGALDSGRLVAWDCRSGDTRPVALTALSAEAHTHPVFSMHVAGSAAANSVVSVSADGRLCTWPAPPNLGEPSLSTELRWSAGPSTAALGDGELVAATCMAETGGEAADLALGAADGCIYTASLSGRDAGVTGRLQGHAAPVTALRRHPAGSGAMRDVLLSCGMDWSVRVWATGAPADRAEIARLADFDDYVMDAAWCPAPRAASVVAAADNDGCLSLWSAGQEQLGALGKVRQLDGGAVTRVVWAADGGSLLAGDSAGQLRLYTVNHEALGLRGVSSKPLEQALASANLAADHSATVPGTEMF
jgi:WD40 repeat protein